MRPNMGPARAIARSFGVLVALALLPLVAQSQASVRDQSVRDRQVDSALRTYLLPGIAAGVGGRVITPPDTAMAARLFRLRDRARTMVVPLMPGVRSEPVFECPMPVARGTGEYAAIPQTVMDSVAAQAPGSPVPMPTSRFSCVNPLR